MLVLLFQSYWRRWFVAEFTVANSAACVSDVRCHAKSCRTKKKPIPPEHAAYVAAEVGSALHAAHSAIDSRGRPLRSWPNAS